MSGSGDRGAAGATAHSRPIGGVVPIAVGGRDPETLIESENPIAIVAAVGADQIGIKDIALIGIGVFYHDVRNGLTGTHES